MSTNIDGWVSEKVYAEIFIAEKTVVGKMEMKTENEEHKRKFISNTKKKAKDYSKKEKKSIGRMCERCENELEQRRR